MSVSGINIFSEKWIVDIFIRISSQNYIINMLAWISN